MNDILSVDQLSVAFDSGQSRRPVQVVKEVSLGLPASSTLAIIGESGSGKSTLAKGILGLVPTSGGMVKLRGANITDPKIMRVNRRRIQLVSQNPASSFNRRRSIGHALSQPLRIHGLARDGRERAEAVRRLLESVKLPTHYVDRSPSELSGGELQRVAVARALACDPWVIVLDEPTSALDASVKGSILNLLRELQRERGIAYVFITHELDVARRIADEVIVMYLGRIVEKGSAENVFAKPSHPYTQALVASMPVIGARGVAPVAITGEPPSMTSPPLGCAFHPRCPVAIPECSQSQPAMRTVEPGWHAACVHVPISSATAPDNRSEMSSNA